MPAAAPTERKPRQPESPDSGSRGKSEPRQDAKAPGFWQKRLIQPIRNQLTQGVSPGSLSIGVSAGTLCGIFPVLGTTTVLTTATAFLFRLNQPVMQSINWLAYPLQLVLIPVYIRGGEMLLGADPISFSLPQMMESFADSPGDFFTKFKMTFVHCIAAWVVTAPLLGAAIALAVLPAIKAAAKRMPQFSSGTQQDS